MRLKNINKNARVYHVPCVGGNVHRIIVGKSGHVKLQDCHNVDAELAMFKMAGHRVSTCVLAMCRLRGWHNVLGLGTAAFPPRLRALFFASNRKRTDRSRDDAKMRLLSLEDDDDCWQLRAYRLRRNKAVIDPNKVRAFNEWIRDEFK